MAKDPTNKLGRSRTDELRREIDQATRGWGGLGGLGRMLTSRSFVMSALIWLGFVAVVGTVVVLTRELPKVAEGRVMNSTRVSRAEFRIVDDVATDQARKTAQLLAPRVCVLVAGAIEEVRAGLENLPLTVQNATSLEEIDPEVRKQFGLSVEAVQALRGELVEGKVGPQWLDRLQRLQMELLRTPILTEEDFREVTQTGRMIELRLEGRSVELLGPSVGPLPMDEMGARSLMVSTSSAISLESTHLPQDLRKLALAAGFSGVMAEVVTTRLNSPVRATYTFDAAATAARLEEAADLVPAKIVSFPRGEVVYKRGERLKPTDLTKVRAMAAAERNSLAWWQRWLGRAALLSLVGAIALGLAGYTALFVPRVRRNPARVLGIASLLAISTLIGCWAAVAKPEYIALTGVAPTVFATVILAVAYHQRVALAYGCLHGLLMCIALDQSVGLYAIIVAGIGVAVWQLKEVRDRDAIIRMGILEAVALAAGTLVVNIIELPLTRDVLVQAGRDAGWAGFGGLLVSGVTLYLLPTLERRFGLLTGMTLIELRDPKQPLLRQLQQRAPGTYNHSLTIASLGEAAAEAIGADGLLTYVGALYHDIGKMNKPDYFVENQTPGINRHDKLSPAMSLLVIVGHVKDGLELAREFNLPKPLHHFIESHHGTTLVEYFFHRAKKQAEAAAVRAGGDDSEEAEVPAEIEYRYPGPRPRTKEAAILMVCDAVESASRALGDPTPSRIDQLVRSIANKRLLDGQFDECDLTLRELNVIVETVSKTLASIYHGRIQYPTAPAPSETQSGMGSGIVMGPKTTAGGTPVGAGTAGGGGPGTAIINGSGARERTRAER